MRGKVAIAATLLSFALVGSAAAQQVIYSDPVTGLATGAAAGAQAGAAAAGPLGAIIGAPLGAAFGAIGGTLGAVGTIGAAVTGAPVYTAAYPAGYYTAYSGYPVTTTQVAFAQPAAPQMVYYAQPATAQVAFAQPAASPVVYVSSRRGAYRTARFASRRALVRRASLRTRAAQWR